MAEPMDMLGEPVLTAIAALLSSRSEVADPAERHYILAVIDVTTLGTALMLMEGDPEYAGRWAAADGWLAKAEVLHDAITMLITPEAAPEKPERTDA